MVSVEHHHEQANLRGPIVIQFIKRLFRPRNSESDIPNWIEDHALRMEIHARRVEAMQDQENDQ